MRITIFMPVSREQYLDAIFARLELLECDRAQTNLLVMVDGNESLYVRVRNLVEMSKFAERLCVQFKSKHKLRHFDILGRRLRITDIHNDARQYISSCDFVFGLEDDTVILADALARLLRDYAVYPHAGMIEGVQLARWGIPHVGAWRVDDVYEPTLIESARVGSGVELVDAGGFYCYLTKRDSFINHEYKPFSRNVLGPDVDWGLELRRGGLLNYVDWDVKTVHKTRTGEVSLANTPEVRVVSFNRRDDQWRQSNRP